MNSDDVYTDEALVLLNTYINKYPTKDFIFGAVKKHWGTLYGFKPYKIFGAGVFIQVIQQDFLLKKILPNKK